MSDNDLDPHLKALEDRVAATEYRLDRLEPRLTALEQRVIDLDRDMRGFRIQLTEAVERLTKLFTTFLQACDREEDEEDG